MESATWKSEKKGVWGGNILEFMLSIIWKEGSIEKMVQLFKIHPQRAEEYIGDKTRA